MNRPLGVVLAAAALVLLLTGAAWVAAGRGAKPAIEIVHPVSTVGASDRLEVTVDTPGGRLASLDVAFEQDGRQTPLFSLANPTATLQQETPERVRLSRSLGRSDLPGLRPGAARVIVRAARPVLFGLRHVEVVAARSVDVRLDPPRVDILSEDHAVSHGGAEFVVYRVTPPDSASGVRVGDLEFPGYPASGAHVAVFALPYDQDLSAAVEVFARDPAGNVARAPLKHRVVPRPVGRSRVDLDDRFLSRVVPQILAHASSPGQPSGDPVAAFLLINGDMRQRNSDQLAALASKTAPEMLWRRAFLPPGHTAIQTPFADYRTYFYKGREIDRQVHLGLDLAAMAGSPVPASNRGTVILAEYLGVYGNTVIVDHGLGVQSLYAYLSSLGVKVGDTVEQGQPIGASGHTGLADADSVHFTMLVHGHMVSPTEWWDPQWIEEHIVQRLREALP